MDTPICPKCKGEGRIMTSFRQVGYDQVQVPCPRCKGSGKKPPIYQGPMS